MNIKNHKEAEHLVITLWKLNFRISEIMYLAQLNCKQVLDIVRGGKK